LVIIDGFLGFSGPLLDHTVAKFASEKEIEKKINLIEQLLIAKLLIDNYRWIFGVFGAII